MSRSRVVASQPTCTSAASSLSLTAAILSRLLVPAASVCSPACPPRRWSQCRTHFADGAPPVSAAVGAWGAVALPYPEQDVQGEDTGGAVELTRASPAVPPDSAGSRAAPPHPPYR